MKDCKLVRKIGVMVLTLVWSFGAVAQDYYSGRDFIDCDTVMYRITHYSNAVYIENAANCLRSEPRYKVGSNPKVYYTYASGMGHLALSDTAQFNKIVKEVFSEDEIKAYTDSQGDVFLTYVVDPVGGKVLEVDFRISMFNGDKTLLAIPIEKFSRLEMLIKQSLVCHISEELKAERQSYTLSGDSLFAE